MAMGRIVVHGLATRFLRATESRSGCVRVCCFSKRCRITKTHYRVYVTPYCM